MDTLKKFDDISCGDVARHDKSHCLAPNLFRNLRQGERKKSKLDVSHTYGEGDSQVHVRFIGFEPLDATDLRILQGLVALTGADGILLNPEPETFEGRQLRLALETQYDAAEKSSLVAKTSRRSLFDMIGMECTGQNVKKLNESLLRLSNITVHSKGRGLEMSSNLLSYMAETKDGRMLIALNPLIAAAIMGGGNAFVTLRMEEVRQIKSSYTRLIHQRLCAWIDEGSKGRVNLDTLIEYIWGSYPANTDVEQRVRRTRARASLRELAEIGWGVFEYSKDRWEIHRPKTVN